jgi:FlaA1/EpsC-like NDP-sugar epimerase
MVRLIKKDLGKRILRVLIAGAGVAGSMVAREIQEHHALGLSLEGFVDDDPDKLGKSILDKPILGTITEIPAVAKKLSIDRVLICIPSAPGKVIRRIVQECEEAEVEFKIVPGIFEILDDRVKVSRMREVQVEDLLRRKAVVSDLKAIKDHIVDKDVLVTGAAGSIGSELCRQISDLSPSTLIALDNEETNLFELELELRQRWPDSKLEIVLCDVRETERIERVFGNLKPSVVFHAAAYKHVPMMERFPEEAVFTNVLGTKNLAEVSKKSGVERFVFISTDKAVNPTSVMGASKRIAEMVIGDLAEENGTSFIVVRFGNVLGSRGSVVPIFKRQISRGGPITITHPDMIRYFMTVPEAVQLVIQAGSMGNGGEIFVLDMGEPVRIVDLAKDLIKLSGLEPEIDIDIEFVGVRPGEKLYEELFTENESLDATKNERIFLTMAEEVDKTLFEKQLSDLFRLAGDLDRDGVLRQIKEIIPMYGQDGE